MTHKAATSFISRTQKTAKTECGKTVEASEIAIDADCTCWECKAVIDGHWNGAYEALEMSIAHGLDKEGELSGAMDAAYPRRYRTVYFP